LAVKDAMFANSSPVNSNQENRPHRRLQEIVARHLAQPFLKPVTAYNQAAFNFSMDAWHVAGKPPLILDAGCGVGLSTYHLAIRFPDHFVIGVDQSAHRLSRIPDWNGRLPENCVRIRADLTDYWRLLHATGIATARQYLLYPNPWPKAAHVRRRWHAHPVFPVMAMIGGIFECRSNWPVYIEECASALTAVGAVNIEYGRYAPSEIMTPFERKYLASGHEVWRCTARLPGRNAAFAAPMETDVENV
jgi:tRNA G46 methylase TrmB